MICERCGKEYEETGERKKRHFCSNSCRNSHYKWVSKKRSRAIRRCHHCGELFESHNANKIYCSKLCCGRAHRKKHHVSVVRHVVCVRCGVLFTSGGGRKRSRIKYCSDKCATDAKNEMTLAWQKAKVLARAQKRQSSPRFERESANISSVQHCPADQLERLIGRIVSGEVEYYHNGVTA